MPVVEAEATGAPASPPSPAAPAPIAGSAGVLNDDAGNGAGAPTGDVEVSGS
jgi:hypothetical protein